MAPKNKPKPQPNATAAQPNATAAQPNATAAQPNATAAQPNATADQPNATADQPNATADQPNATADQPNATADQPNATAAQPNATADQPNATADQPNAATDQANATADQANATADQPNATADQPNAATDQANATADQPNAATDQANATADQPNATADQPNATADQAGAATDQANTTAEQVEETLTLLKSTYEKIAPFITKKVEAVDQPELVRLIEEYRRLRQKLLELGPYSNKQFKRLAKGFLIKEKKLTSLSNSTTANETRGPDLPIEPPDAHVDSTENKPSKESSEKPQAPLVGDDNPSQPEPDKNEPQGNKDNTETSAKTPDAQKTKEALSSAWVLDLVCSEGFIAAEGFVLVVGLVALGLSGFFPTVLAGAAADVMLSGGVVAAVGVLSLAASFTCRFFNQSPADKTKKDNKDNLDASKEQREGQGMKPE